MKKKYVHIMRHDGNLYFAPAQLSPQVKQVKPSKRGNIFTTGSKDAAQHPILPNLPNMEPKGISKLIKYKNWENEQP